VLHKSKLPLYKYAIIFVTVMLDFVCTAVILNKTTVFVHGYLV